MEKDTLKIKLKTSLANPHRGWDSGEVVDWPAEDARRLVAGGYAEFWGADPGKASPSRK